MGSTNAILSHPNSLRVFGPPGSGKTSRLVDIGKAHVEKGDFNIREAIIVSFTRAAAEDIAKRINPDQKPGRNHCTIHALCKRYYRINRAVADPKVGDFFKSENIPYTRRSADPGDLRPEERLTEGEAMMTFWNLCRNVEVSLAEGRLRFPQPEELAPWWGESGEGEKMDQLFHRYQQWKIDNDLVDFTDMLETAVEDPPTGKWSAVLLDEAQDCSPLQWRVINAFAQCAERLYIAGDDDQAIYDFNGATPAEFLNADVSRDRVLDVNHRSGHRLVGYTQAFIRRNSQRKEKGVTAARQGGAVGISGARVFDPSTMLTPKESAFILGRAHYLTEPFAEALTEAGYPFVDKRRRYGGVDDRDAPTYGRYLRFCIGERMQLEEWGHLLPNISATQGWLEPGTEVAMRTKSHEELVETWVTKEDLLSYGATAKLVEAMEQAAPHALRGLRPARLQYYRDVATKHGVKFLDEETAAKACRLGSIHSVKGLEADHVILCSGMPPRAVDPLDEESERRVIYVGMTRARNRLTLARSTNADSHWEDVLVGKRQQRRRADPPAPRASATTPPRTG